MSTVKRITTISYPVGKTGNLSNDELARNISTMDPDSSYVQGLLTVLPGGWRVDVEYDPNHFEDGEGI